MGPYRLEIATDFGPRITSLRLGDGREQFAILGTEAALEHPGGSYLLRGGHRLWAAPEDPRVTYASDDHTCAVSESNGVVTVTAVGDSAGLIKQMSVSAEQGSLVVEHRLTQASCVGHEVAAWAISQMPLGGTAILPFGADDTRRQANRYLVFWPYTSIEDRRMTLDDEAIEVEASDGPELKLGVGPTPRRLGYYLDGSVFIKEIESAFGRKVPDFGAVGQVYVGQGFCELESVGGLSNLADGAGAVLRERWTIAECADLDGAVQLTVAA